MWFVWLMYSMRMCEWAKRSLWVFLARSSCREIQVRARLIQEVFSFFLSFLLDYISGLLDCLCFLWRDQNGHAALDGTDKKPQKAKVMLSWTQRPRSSLSRGWKSSSLLARCDITCLNYYHRNNSDVISFTLLNWLTLWRGLIRMW